MRPRSNDKRCKTLSTFPQVSEHTHWSRQGVEIPTDQMVVDRPRELDAVSPRQPEMVRRPAPSGQEPGRIPSQAGEQDNGESRVR
jgi:hypothetical protein